ncbi:hypothetical protein CXB51_034751 [Gossypium anomalum]|uniref:Uncharacterized protein n=1 Tax=Gossypium anomalum TaxID=47600 RepID=A0A8J5XWP9_9ROSI|nr:hypothetical protein CXB51_034751 [Gossypium anomalum]
MLFLLHSSNLVVAASATTRYQNQVVAARPHHQALAGKKTHYQSPKNFKDHDAIFSNRDILVAAINGSFDELDIVWRSNCPELHKLRKLVLNGEEAKLRLEINDRLEEFVGLMGEPNLSDIFPMLRPFDLQGIEFKTKRYLSWFYGFLELVIEQRTKLKEEPKMADVFETRKEERHG